MGTSFFFTLEYDMSDRFQAELYIAGPLRKEDLEAVLAEIDNEGCEEVSFDKDIQEIRVVCYEARGGKLEKVERELYQRKMAYRRVSEGYSEYPPEAEVYTGEGSVRRFTLDSDGDVVTTTEQVKSNLRRLRKVTEEDGMDLPMLIGSEEDEWIKGYVAAILEKGDSAQTVVDFMLQKYEEQSIPAQPYVSLVDMTGKEFKAILKPYLKE